VAILVVVVALSFGFGFLLLPRYQAAQGPYSVKDSLYHALGLHTHGKQFATVQPPLKVPTHIAWTDATIREATNGDAKRGEFIALNCSMCHVEQAKSSEPWIPLLAGLDRLVTFKQLDDFRSGTRLSGPMSAIAQSMTQQDYADVAAYYALQAGMPESTRERMPHSHRTYRSTDPLQRLIFAGDPKRGIAACASCHGPGGYLIGAPSLSNQNAAYLEQQLQAFAQGTRTNDMNMPMRTIAALLTADEMKALASAYAKGLDGLK
jgi:cytochrome c553